MRLSLRAVRFSIVLVNFYLFFYPTPPPSTYVQVYSCVVLCCRPPKLSCLRRGKAVPVYRVLHPSFIHRFDPSQSAVLKSFGLGFLTSRP